MQIPRNLMNRLGGGLGFALLFALTMTLLSALQSRADLILVGDTDPAPGTFPDNAGDVGGDLTIGVTGTGGLFMDLAPPLDGLLMPLESENGIIGDEEDAIGAAVFDDFGVEWLIEDQLTVGNEGQGFLDLFDSAQIVVGDDTSGTTVIGSASTGRGDVTVNGVGTLLNAGDLSVGLGGVGTLSVNSRASLRSRISNVGSEIASGDGLVTLTDRGTRWSVRDVLTVGGLAGASHGTIEIQNEAILQVETSASLTVNPRGMIDLAGGTIRMLPQASNLIINNGTIVGDGFIDGGLSIGAAGELRNASAQVTNGTTLVDLRENLIIAEEVLNDGTIQSIGGAMEFHALVTNNFEIIARDAEMHFRQGIDNSGVITIGGDTLLHTGVSPSALTMNGGQLLVLSNSESLLDGDLVYTASAVLGLSVGEEAGTLDVTGAANLEDALIDLSYYSAAPSEDDDVYQIFQAAGGITPPTFNLAVADGRIWNLNVVGGTTLVASATTALAMPMGADFNGDGVVNALDLLVWENNYPIASGATTEMGDADGDGDVDGADFFQIQGDLGGPPSAMALATAVVPEPSTLVMAMLTLVVCPRRRVGR